MANLGTGDSGIGGIAAKMAKVSGELKVLVDTGTDVKAAEAKTKQIATWCANLMILLGRTEVQQGL
jgi:hypothetical protein